MHPESACLPLRMPRTPGPTSSESEVASPSCLQQRPRLPPVNRPRSNTASHQASHQYLNSIRRASVFLVVLRHGDQEEGRRHD
jgi:hypothetical protein